MAVFRVNRNKNYTHMANYHFRDTTLSWKAKGILSNMLSLPDDWDYSLAGLATLASDGTSATRSAIKELEEHGYLIRRPIRKDGKIADWEYLIYEKPQVGNQDAEKLFAENQQIENETQLSTNQSSTKESSKNKLSNKENKREKKTFVPPTLEDVEKYCKERNNGVDAKKFFDFYNEADWIDSKGNPVRNWKQKMISTWESKKTERNDTNGSTTGNTQKARIGHYV